MLGGCLLATLTLAQTYLFTPESTEDWRGALGKIAELERTHELDVFLQPCFSEQLSVEWINDPKVKEVLLSPLKRYSVKSKVQYVPCLLDYPPFRKVFEDQIEDTFKARRSFVLLTRYENTSRELVNSWAAANGYASPQFFYFGMIEVALYQ